MIHGSGLVATALRGAVSDPRIAIYAAGVSNSACTDAAEFARERGRLTAALEAERDAERFVYFGTCSVSDSAAAASAYVRHKLAMEALVRERHARPLILRLPQVAGRTPNPHTLLNYLYQRIARSEKFRVLAHATRNVIDVEDVARIARALVVDEGAVGETINVAAPVSLPAPEIVATMARVVGKPAVFDLVGEGSAYAIDTSRIAALVARLGIAFDAGYLERTLRKYYPPAHG